MNKEEALLIPSTGLVGMEQNENGSFMTDIISTDGKVKINFHSSYPVNYSIQVGEFNYTLKEPIRNEFCWEYNFASSITDESQLKLLGLSMNVMDASGKKLFEMPLYIKNSY